MRNLESGRIKAVITDLDGTLLRSKKQDVSDKDYKSLEALGDAGIIRIAATGRSVFSADRVLPSGFPLDFLVFTNGIGTMEFKTRKQFNTHGISPGKVLEAVKKLDEIKADFQVRAAVPDTHAFIYRQHSEKNEEFDILIQEYKQHTAPLEDYSILGAASRIICFTDKAADIEKVKNLCDGFDIIRATSPINHHSIWIELYPPGINKGFAVKELCNKLQISADETLGIGNDYNDIHFLDFTANPFLTSNAPQELKSKYPMLDKSNDESAFTEMLNRSGVL